MGGAGEVEWRQEEGEGGTRGEEKDGSRWSCGC